MNNDKTIRKELDKKSRMNIIETEVAKEFCLFVLIEEPWQSESHYQNAGDLFGVKYKRPRVPIT